jgi:hypothetical protein
MERREPWTPGRIGWVIEMYEDGEVLWWNNDDGWGSGLHDWATIFTDDEATRGSLPFDGTYVPLFTHEIDGVGTTEECEGVATCQDCLDVARQLREGQDEPTWTARTIEEAEVEAFIGDRLPAGTQVYVNWAALDE